MKIETDKYLDKLLISHYFGIDYTTMSYSEILHHMKVKTDAITKQWIDSREKDFSIYTHHDYIADIYVCWNCISKHSIKNLYRWLQANEKNPERLTIFDDYNGLGLTSLYFVERGFNVSFSNDVKAQRDVLKWCCKEKKLKMPTLDNKRSKKYDIVMSFEVAEHFKEPLVYIKKIMKMTKKYLVLTTGFKKVYAGHFSTYFIDEHNRRVPIVKAGRMVRNEIKKEFELVYVGFNGKPSIYKRKDKSNEN